MSYSFEFPFSIFVFEAPLRPGGKAHWNEVLRANNQQWAIYAAGLLHNAGMPHQDTIRERPVVKAVRDMASRSWHYPTIKRLNSASV
jgi:hypothetical protein